MVGKITWKISLIKNGQVFLTHSLLLSLGELKLLAKETLVELYKKESFNHFKIMAEANNLKVVFPPRATLKGRRVSA